jgi:uncharacterized protein YfbU (UPF0304 family)
MKLTRLERWILSNQMQILAKLQPDDAEHYDLAREALERGYELNYGWLAEHIADRTLSEDECTEVLDILDMFRALESSHSRFGAKPGVDDWQVRFGGFDANDPDEARRLGYFRHLRKEGKYESIGAGDDNGFNSHTRVLARYRRQLAIWKPITPERRNKLSEADYLAVAAAALPPSQRS